MALKPFLSIAGLRKLIKLILDMFKTKLDKSSVINNLETDDPDAPLSAAQGKLLKEQIEMASGDISKILDKTGKIKTEYLPAYLDDVVEGYYDHDNEIFWKNEAKTDVYEPASDIIYIDLKTEYSYRWSGTKYVDITSPDMVEIETDEVTELWYSIHKFVVTIAVDDKIVPEGTPVENFTYRVYGLDGEDILVTAPTLTYDESTKLINASGAVVPNNGKYDPNIVYRAGHVTIISGTESQQINNITEYLLNDEE